MSAALTVVGTGIRAIQQMTREAEAAIRAADALLFLVAEPLTERWLRGIHPHARSLGEFYEQSKPRATSL
jgi:precorrin-3B methylase